MDANLTIGRKIAFVLAGNGLLKTSWQQQQQAFGSYAALCTHKGKSVKMA
jgi:hypothetical protein